VDPRCLPSLHAYCAGCVRELKIADLPVMTVRCVKCDPEYPVPRHNPVSASSKCFGVVNLEAAATIAAEPAGDRAPGTVDAHGLRAADVQLDPSAVLCGRGESR
jgi:hypothetical protein